MADGILNSLFGQKMANALRQYVYDVQPGGLLNPEVPPGGPTELAKGLLGFTPGVGDAISGLEALRAAKEGKYGEAGLNALGLLPFVPSLGGVTIMAPNKTNPMHLERVIGEMKTLGAPEVRAYWDGEKYIALEGSHRLAAAEALGMTPTINEVRQKQWLTNHDLYDLPDKTSVARALNYLSGGTTPHFFDNLK